MRTNGDTSAAAGAQAGIHLCALKHRAIQFHRNNLERALATALRDAIRVAAHRGLNFAIATPEIRRAVSATRSTSTTSEMFPPQRKI